MQHENYSATTLELCSCQRKVKIMTKNVQELLFRITSEKRGTKKDCRFYYRLISRCAFIQVWKLRLIYNHVTTMNLFNSKFDFRGVRAPTNFRPMYLFFNPWKNKLTKVLPCIGDMERKLAWKRLGRLMKSSCYWKFR